MLKTGSRAEDRQPWSSSPLCGQVRPTRRSAQSPASSETESNGVRTPTRHVTFGNVERAGRDLTPIRPSSPACDPSDIIARTSSICVEQLDHRRHRVDCCDVRRPDDELDVREAGGAEGSQRVAIASGEPRIGVPKCDSEPPTEVGSITSSGGLPDRLRVAAGADTRRQRGPRVAARTPRGRSAHRRTSSRWSAWSADRRNIFGRGDASTLVRIGRKSACPQR